MLNRLSQTRFSHPLLWVNGLWLLLAVGLTLYARFFGEESVKVLFLEPQAFERPEIAALTRTFQILCSVPAIACAFTYGLLRTLQPRRSETRFILASALITTGFLLNEIFRIHILLVQVGIPKYQTIFVFALVVLAYGIHFRRRLQVTPYPILLLGLGLLAFAIVIDSLGLPGQGKPALLEGFPKLFSILNISIYYWLVCHQQVLRQKLFSLAGSEDQDLT